MPEPAKSGPKQNPWLRKQITKKFSFEATEDIKQLSATQKSNQKVVLSFYGLKIDMPFKMIASSQAINMTTYLADIKAGFELVDSYKVEITHPLGITHFRVDIPKGTVASVMTGDAFALAELNMKAKREFEDYLVNRRQYDLEFSAMDINHRQVRLGRKYEYISKGIDLVVGIASLGVSGIKTGMSVANLINTSKQNAIKEHQRALKKYEKNPLFGSPPPEEPEKWGKIGYRPIEVSLTTGLGAYKGVTGIASGIVGLVSASERAALQEEGFGVEIRNKALQSYTIDLGFERQKEDQLFTMRRLFANETYNDVTNRQRQKALDEYETPKVDDIYLEVWTTSGLQDGYVKDYHDKYGVDCRVQLNQFDTALKIHDEIREGIYCIEDVVIENLADRIELEFLKARLIGGIRFVKWEEHPQVKELTPIDKRILELQTELAEVQSKKRQQEQDCQDTISRLSDDNDKLQHNLSEQRQKYHELSDSFRHKEAELSEQTNLAVLYKNEADHFKQDLLKESSQYATEKESHSSTKAELATKTSEVESLTKQVDRQIKEIEQQKTQINSLSNELASCKQQKATADRQKQRVQQQKEQAEKERDEALAQLRSSGLQPEVDRLTGELEAKKRELQEKTRELTGLQDSLGGLHAIVKSKDGEIAELKAKVNNVKPLWYLTRYKKKSFRGVEEQSLKEVVPSIFQSLFEPSDLVITGFEDKFYFCQFSYKWLCWIVAKDNDDWAVYKYDYEAIFRVAKKGDPKGWENDYYSYNWPSYFGRKASSYAWFIGELKLGIDNHDAATSWLTRKRIKTIGTKNPIPVFKVEGEEMTKQTPVLRVCYYNPKDGTWNENQDTERSLIQISNYGEYLELLGLDIYDLAYNNKALDVKGKSVEEVYLTD